MVVWVYAGGGEAEGNGFVPFLQRHLNCSFERRTPKPRPGPRPGIVVYSGATGKSLADEIRDDIRDYWNGSAQVILVLDDTDGILPSARLQVLDQAVHTALAAKQVAPPLPEIVVALAVPELEIWLLADWSNTFEKAFPNCHRPVQYELSRRRGVSFRALEDFVVVDPSGHYHKISEIIKEVIRLKCNTNPVYSKATDTPRLLLQSDPAAISRKCPHFRLFWNRLTRLC